MVLQQICASQNRLIGSLTPWRPLTWPFDRSLLQKLSDVKPFDVLTGDRTPLHVYGKGEVTLFVLRNGEPVSCILKDVKYVLTLSYQLLSGRVMKNQGTNVLFGPTHCEVKRGAKLVAMGSVRDNLYYLDTCKIPNCSAQSNGCWSVLLACSACAR